MKASLPAFSGLKGKSGLLEKDTWRSWASQLELGLVWPPYEQVNPGLHKALAMEFVCTTLFVFLGTGAVAFGCHGNPADTAFGDAATGSVAACPNLYTTGRVLTIATAFGLAIYILVFSAASFSGGHINPAVTMGFLIAKKITFMRAFLYWICQMLGAILGSAFVYAVDRTGFHASKGGTNAVIGGVSEGSAWLMEAILTSILVLTVFAATDGARAKFSAHLAVLAPMAIGFTVFACHLVAVPIDGCSINPARSFGPAVISGHWQNQWVFWIGPWSGAILSGLFYEMMLRPGKLDYDNDSDSDSSDDEDIEAANGPRGGVGKEDDIDMYRAGSTASTASTIKRHRHHHQHMSMPTYAGVSGNRVKVKGKQMKVVMVPDTAPLPVGAVDNPEVMETIHSISGPQGGQGGQGGNLDKEGGNVDKKNPTKPGQGGGEIKASRQGLPM